MKRGAESSFSSTHRQEYRQFRFGGGLYDDDPYNSDTSSGSTIGCGGFLARIAASTVQPAFKRSSSSPPPAPISSSSPRNNDNSHNNSSNNNNSNTNEYTSEAEALMVKELTDLSLKERKGIEEEIHGVGDEITETAALTQQALTDFQTELDEIVVGSEYHPAYEMALQKSPSYVNDFKTRLLFLRADKFDGQRAAKRFVKYLEATIEFFGQDKLCEEITWNDLSADNGDRKCVETCSFWVDDFDQKGRRLAWIFPQYEIYDNYKNQIRNVWYQIMKALKDEETQKKGFIKVVYYLGGTQSRMKKTTSMDTELFFKGITRIFEVLPFRLAALHYCFDDPKFRPVIATVQYVIGKAGRLRFRAHYGSHVECQYALMTFGIPRKNIPISDNGDVPVSMNKFYSYLEDIRKDEPDYRNNNNNNNNNNTNHNEDTLMTTTTVTTTMNIIRADTPPTSSNGGKNNIKNNTTPNNNKKGKGNNNNKKTSKKSKKKSNGSAGSLVSITRSSSGNSAEGGISPTSNDVLLGRGKPFQEYPGNLRLAILVDRYREKYMEAGRCDKAIISQHLVDQIKKADGRFLKKLTSDGPWIEVSDEVARDKVGHGFRTKPRKIFNPVPLKSSVNAGNNNNNNNNMTMTMNMNNNNAGKHHPNNTTNLNNNNNFLHHNNNNMINHNNNNNHNNIIMNNNHNNNNNNNNTNMMMANNNNGNMMFNHNHNNNNNNTNMMDTRATPSILFDGGQNNNNDFFGGMSMMTMPDDAMSVQDPNHHHHHQGINNIF